MLSKDFVRSFVRGATQPFVPAGSAAIDGLLVEDTFTDSDGTLLSAHTPDTDNIGTGWQNATAVSITSNELVADTTQDESPYFDLTGYSSKIVRITKGASVATYLGVNVRWQDASNLVQGGDVPESAGSAPRIFTKEAGTYTLRASGSTKTWTTLWVADDGSTITVGVDGASTAEISYSTSLFSAETKVGLYVNTTVPKYTSTTFMGDTTNPGDLP